MSEPTRDQIVEQFDYEPFAMADEIVTLRTTVLVERDHIEQLRASLAAVEAERDAWAKGFERRGLTPEGRDATPEEAQYIVADTFGRIETLTQQLAAVEAERDKYAGIVSAFREGGTDGVRIAVRDGITLLTRKKYTLGDVALVIQDAYMAALDPQRGDA